MNDVIVNTFKTETYNLINADLEASTIWRNLHHAYSDLALEQSRLSTWLERQDGYIHQYFYTHTEISEFDAYNCNTIWVFIGNTHPDGIDAYRNEGEQLYANWRNAC